MSDRVIKIQQKKIDAVAALKDEFKDAKDFIFADYRGLTVGQITELRKKLREKQASCKVVKNRFAKLALKELSVPVPQDKLIGPTAMILSRDDTGAVAKILLETSKDSTLQVKGGVVEGTIFSAEEIEAYSKLPGRKELLSMLLGTMKAPMQNVVYVLSGVPTKFVRTLQAVADKKGA